MKNFLLHHWVGLLAIFGGIAVSWAQWSYITKTVNPETVLEFQIEQTREAERRDIRWCLGKAALRDESAKQALECAD